MEERAAEGANFMPPPPLPQRCLSCLLSDSSEEKVLLFFYLGKSLLRMREVYFHLCLARK